MKPKTFLAAQFFILSLSFSAFFDPIGISYLLMGVVWMFSKKLAYLEVFLVFLFKAEYSWAFLIPMSAIPVVIRPIIPIEAIGAFLWGAILAVGISGKIIMLELKRKAPDLLGLIRK
jgi:hypothetical protein